MNNSTNSQTHSLTSNPITDFWLLGGLSIVVWAILILFDPIRTSSELISSRFLQLSVVFTWLSFVCNYPHFLISYKFGYGRGSRFILANKFPLIFVPLVLIGLFLVAYFFYDKDISKNYLVILLNYFLLKIGLVYQIGNANGLGTEILTQCIRLMYITVGWHYSKQVFGCIMVYAKYTNYSFSNNQRTLLKINLFSIAFYNFFYLAIPTIGQGTTSYFYNLPLEAIGFSEYFIPFFKYTTITLSICTIYFVFYLNYKKTKLIPSINLLIPFIAFHVWWFPIIRQTEFYFLIIPFFHSLQYLPFAYRLETSHEKSKFISFKIALLILVGFLSFEMIPNLLDAKLETYAHYNTWFFLIAIPVFLNIHHFFIDSAVWKFKNNDIQAKLLN